MSIEATAVIKKEIRVDPFGADGKGAYAYLSLRNAEGKAYGPPRYLPGFRELAILLVKEAGVTHEQLHERKAYYERGEEIGFPLMLESVDAIRRLGFDPEGARG